jgi:hypothetical protein
MKRASTPCARKYSSSNGSTQARRSIHRRTFLSCALAPGPQLRRDVLHDGDAAPLASLAKWKFIDGESTPIWRSGRWRSKCCRVHRSSRSTSTARSARATHGGVADRLAVDRRPRRRHLRPAEALDDERGVEPAQRGDEVGGVLVAAHLRHVMNTRRAMP